MALKLNTNQVGLSALLKEGHKNLQGVDEAVIRNISACKALSEITRSSFGPNGSLPIYIFLLTPPTIGLSKLVVNNLEKIFLTNDAGTIMKELDVEHPAAKLVLMASQQQEKEMGDGTNLVIVLAGQLLQNAEELIRIGIRPSLIVEGYEMAHRKAVELINQQLVINTISDLHSAQEQDLRSLLQTVVGSKHYGWQGLLTNLLLQALRIAHAPSSSSTPPQFNPENVQCAKLLGGSLPMSHVVAGMLLEREPMGSVHRVEQAKIAVFACPINVSRTETKGTVLIKGAEDLLGFSRGEERLLEQQVAALRQAGITVLVTGDTIGELALHFIERHQMMALKVPSKFDLRRLCKAVNATPLARLGVPTEEEAGFCDLVEAVEIGGTRCTLFRQEAKERSRLATIVLRSNTSNLLDQLERAIEDALYTLRSLSKDGRLMVGGGAAEMELARLLTQYGETTPGIAQYAIRKYSEAFEAIPRLLAYNAGHDGTQVVAKLYWAHNQGQIHAGVDVEGNGGSGEGAETTVEECTARDALVVKRSAIHLATEAALTVLRVDQIIMSKPAGGPKSRAPGPQDSDD